MTGPQHYQEAERLIIAANQRLTADDSQWLQTPARRTELRAEAQVHAALALAAATAIGSPDLPSGDWDDWRFVASAGHAGRIPGSERAVTP
jgi:hypothetical protein